MATITPRKNRKGQLIGWQAKFAARATRSNSRRLNVKLTLKPGRAASRATWTARCSWIGDQPSK